MPPLKRKTIQASEEVACVRAYDAAVASRETPIPFEQVIEKIERDRGRISRRVKKKKPKSRRDADATV